MPTALPSHDVDTGLAPARTGAGPTDPVARRGPAARDPAHRRHAPGRLALLVLPFLLVIVRDPDRPDHPRQAARATNRCCSICSGARPRARTSASSRTSSTRRRPRASSCGRAMQAAADPLRAATATARRRSGAGGWLFYAPGITAVGGPAVPRSRACWRRAGTRPRRGRCGAVARSAAGGPRLRALPRARAGSALVLFPVPDKASLQPARAARPRPATARRRARRATRTAPRFAAELERAGVLVFDPTPARARSAGERAVLHGAGHALDAGVDGRGRRRSSRSSS